MKRAKSFLKREEMKRAKSFLKREEIKRDNPVLMGRRFKIRLLV